MKKIKTAQIPKRLENELISFSEQLNKSIHQAFINQVVYKMNKTTIGKFTDAQRGGYAKIITELIKEFKQKINKRYSVKRIKKFIKSLYLRASKYNKTIISNNLNETMGIHIDDLVKAEGLTAFIEAKAIETTKYYEKFISDTSGTLETSLLRYAGNGMAIEDMVNSLQKEAAKGNKKASFLARNEIKNLNTQLTKKRANNLGIKRGIWRGSLDERERECHRKREGITFELNKGLYLPCDRLTLIPGEDFNCRCTVELIVNDILKKG